MDKKDIIFANLAEENRVLPAFYERRFAWLSEAAELLLPKEPIEKEELSGVLADVGREFTRALAAAIPSFGDATKEHIRDIDAMLGGLFENDAAAFGDRVADRLTARGLFHLPEGRTHTAPFTVAYVKNPTSDLAFSRLYRRFPSITPLYADSFRAAADAVASGRAAACFLPTEDHLFQRIPSFFSILDFYSFRILARETADENGAAFALLSELPPFGGEDRRYFSCRYSPSDDMTAGTVLRAAAYFGLSPIRLYQELSPSGERSSFVMTASVNAGGRPFGFLTYLYLFTASASFYGIYG